MNICQIITITHFWHIDRICLRKTASSDFYTASDFTGKRLHSWHNIHFLYSRGIFLCTDSSSCGDKIRSNMIFLP